MADSISIISDTTTNTYDSTHPATNEEIKDDDTAINAYDSAYPDRATNTEINNDVNLFPEKIEKEEEATDIDDIEIIEEIEEAKINYTKENLELAENSLFPGFSQITNDMTEEILQGNKDEKEGHDLLDDETGMPNLNIKDWQTQYALDLMNGNNHQLHRYLDNESGVARFRYDSNYDGRIDHEIIFNPDGSVSMFHVHNENDSVSSSELTIYNGLNNEYRGLKIDSYSEYTTDNNDTIIGYGKEIIEVKRNDDGKVDSLQVQ